MALAGLQLAAVDGQRGALSPERVERLKQAITAVVADLGDHEDIDQPSDTADHDTLPPSIAEQVLPAEWSKPGAILRASVDAVASTKRRRPCRATARETWRRARLVPYEAVSRERIGALDPQGVQMVCVMYLEIAGTPSHLRYLLRRVRRRFRAPPCWSAYGPPTMP